MKRCLNAIGRGVRHQAGTTGLSAQLSLKGDRSKLRIGIPRALGHYLYPSLWETFLQAIGVQVVLSAPTTRVTIEQAGLLSETEHCLPFKLFDAHLAELAGRVDVIFIPRILSMRPHHIACPKLGVLPDSARAQLPPEVPILTLDIDERRVPLADSLQELGRLLNVDRATVQAAAEQALTALQQALDAEGSTPRSGALRFLVIGHPYNLHDPFLSELILSKLATLGVCAERVSFARQAIPPEPLKWDMCSVIHDQLNRLDPAVWAGVIQLSSFNCGCDSIAGVLFREVLDGKRIPCMTLVLDGQAGQAGMDTRLEAFVDSIKEQHALAGH
jgi:predicted nucleotide-binding protein (sugar kinase/HSP70/actin superfamily)